MEKLDYWDEQMRSTVVLSKEYNVAKAMKSEYTKRLQRFDQKQAAIEEGLKVGTPRKNVTKLTTLEDAIASLADVEKRFAQVSDRDFKNAEYSALQQRRRHLRKKVVEKIDQRVQKLERRCVALEGGM